MFVCMCACVCVHICVCVHVYVCIYVYVCIWNYKNLDLHDIDCIADKNISDNIDSIINATEKYRAHPSIIRKYESHSKIWSTSIIKSMIKNGNETFHFIPIEKDDRLDKSNYRPVSILIFFVKYFLTTNNK